MEFLTNNRITYIINLCSKTVSNMWQQYGINYMSYNWNETNPIPIIQPNSAPEILLKMIRHIKNVLN